MAFSLFFVIRLLSKSCVLGKEYECTAYTDSGGVYYQHSTSHSGSEAQHTGFLK